MIQEQVAQGYWIVEFRVYDCTLTGPFGREGGEFHVIFSVESMSICLVLHVLGRAYMPLCP